MKVLVAYASKTGSTKGIAEFIGEKLRERGMQVSVLEAKRVGNPEEYEAFVIGSALYMFHWMKEARQFVSRHQKILSSRPVWLFSSGPVGTEKKDAKGRNLIEVSGPKEIDELEKATNARNHRVFFGSLDPAKQGFIYRIVRKSETARKAMPEGDFRDWKEIESWSNTIAGELESLFKPRQRV
jgi:menaquinone-dependent protoporphyrinogen oxidase